MRIQTWDKKVFDVPEENLEGFLQDYNKATNFDPATLSADPNVNPERGTNFGGGFRAALQGIPAIGSYADEAEAWLRSNVWDPAGKDLSYDEYLKNARESTEGAFKNMPEVAYPLSIGTGIVGEAAIAALTGGASLTPQGQAIMGAAYGYGMGEGDWKNRAADAAIVGGASAAIPVAGRYLVKGGKAAINGGKNFITKQIVKQGEKMVEKKMPNTIQALKRVADPETSKVALYTNPKGETNVNILSTLMGEADDYATQAKVATELVKETPKNAGLYNSEIMQGVNDLANLGWKNQITSAIDDVAAGITNQNDKQILSKIANKLSKATQTTIESAENAVEEVELKNVREIVNYAIDQYGKGLSKETKDLLEKRMITEGMAKRVSNKLVNKPLADSAKIPGWMEVGGDVALGLIGNAFGGPGAGFLAVAGKNALRGGTSSAAKKYLINKATTNATQNAVKTAQNAAAKNPEVGRKIVGALLEGKNVSPEMIKPYSKPTTVINQTPIRTIQKQDSMPTRFYKALRYYPTTYQQPIMQSLMQ